MAQAQLPRTATVLASLVWSFIERILPRAATALLMFLVALFMPPSILGAYTWVVLGLTLLQSSFDVAVRQVAVSALGSRAGKRFLTRYQWTFGIVGFLFTSAIICALLLTQPPESHAATLMLFPITFAPIAMAAGTKAVARLQRAGRWKALASAQTVAVVVSLAVSLPLLILTRSILGSAIQLVAVEVIFALAAFWSGRSLGTNSPWGTRPPNSAEIRTQFRDASTYSTLGWGQGQSDRVLVGFFAGIAKLGQYNLAWSVSRSLGDAVVNATVNVVRPKILEADPAERNVAAEKLLIRASLLIFSTIILTILGTHLVLRPILGEQWSDALTAVPIMALCTIPQVFAYSATVYLTQAGRLRMGIAPKILGVIMALPIALLAIGSLSLAAWLSVLREVLVMTWLILAVGKIFPRRPLVVGALGLLTLSSGILLGGAFF